MRALARIRPPGRGSGQRRIGQAVHLKEESHDQQAARTHYPSTSTSRRNFLRASAGAGLHLPPACDRGPPGPQRKRSCSNSIGFRSDGTHPITPRWKTASTRKGPGGDDRPGPQHDPGHRTLVAGQSQFIFQDIAVMLSVRGDRGRKDQGARLHVSADAAYPVLHQGRRHQEAKGHRGKEDRLHARRLAAPDVPGFRKGQRHRRIQGVAGFRSIPIRRMPCCSTIRPKAW